MHVIAPARYQPVPPPRSRRHWPWVLLTLLIVVGAINYLRPLPQPVATLDVPLPRTVTQPVLNWPPDGQAAVAAQGYGLLGTHGTQTPIATASIAKVITALSVLQKQPLKAGENGPTYTVAPADVDLYNSYAAQDGSIIPVEQGEQLSEYQALEAMLVPSANNIADSLARWVFGSQSAYATYATSYLRAHGLDSTTIGSDASGFDPSTTSTASDLTQLGLLALDNPVLMAIAGQSSVTLPVVGTVQNYDTILGNNGITGLKTGNNDADTGAFLFTATDHVGTQDVLLTGAVMGAADLDTALKDSTRLAASLAQGFAVINVVTAGQTVGSLKTAWGDSTAIVTSVPVQLAQWEGTPLTQTHVLNPQARSGTVGQLHVAAGQTTVSTDLRLQHAVNGPSFWWRLTRR